MVSVDDLQVWALQRTHYWTPKIQDGEIRHLENREIAISQRKVIRFL